MCVCICVCITSSILGELSFSYAVLARTVLLLCFAFHFISYPFSISPRFASFSSLSSSFLFSLLSKATPLHVQSHHISRLAFLTLHFTFHISYYIFLLHSLLLLFSLEPIYLFLPVFYLSSTSLLPLFSILVSGKFFILDQTSFAHRERGPLRSCFVRSIHHSWCTVTPNPTLAFSKMGSTAGLINRCTVITGQERDRVCRAPLLARLLFLSLFFYIR